jgi:Zn-dependent protease
MVRRSGTIRLATVLGIRVGVDASWFVVLFLVIFQLSTQFRRTLDSSDTVAYVTAVASALLFFASIVLHELGHALAARREGIETANIDLWFFGGLARLSRDSQTPGEEVRIAAAGPFVTLLVVLVCVGAGIGAVGWHDFIDAVGFRRDGAATPALVLLTWVASINFVLLVFNLIPAYPLDGGRIRRSLLWRATGDRGRGTRAAARIGQVFAYIVMGYGLVLLLAGSFGGLYLLILGFLFGSSAKGAIAQSAVIDRLGEVRVADIMDAEPVSVASDLPLEAALESYFLRYRWGWFPVVDPLGRFVGLLREERARAMETSPGGQPGGLVSSAMERGEEWRIGVDSSLEELVASEPLRQLGGLVAVDAENHVRGVVTLGQVKRALAGALQPPLGPS